MFRSSRSLLGGRGFSDSRFGGHFELFGGGYFIWRINKVIIRLFGMRSEAAKKSLAVVENVGESYELGYKKS